jgi:hypothetical protein
MNQDLMIALEAMDVLNRWVRMEGVSRPRKAIYWLKSHYAIRDALMAGLMTRMRYVQSTVKCNRCQNGIYFDWDGRSRGPCRHCNGSSRVTLKFVETTLGERFTWHSPLEHSSWLGWSMRDLEAITVDDWTPGRNGIDLPVEEAARLLNVVERYWWQQICQESPYSFLDRAEYDDTRHYYFAYSLDLDVPQSACALCGVALPSDPSRWHRMVATRSPGLQIRWPVCDVCGKRDKVWDRLAAIPTPDVAGPELAAWMKRHEQLYDRGVRGEHRRRIVTA